MLKSMLAAGVVAGGLIAFLPLASAAVVSPAGLNSVADQPNNLIEVRRRGGHGFHGHGFGGRRILGGRHFSHRGFGHRHFGHRHRRGGWPFLYGALPFIGYGAYSYGYGYRSGCGWLWRRYQITGSRYWYRRWQDCRYY